MIPTADTVNGQRAFPSLGGIPDQLARTVEVVDDFRPSEEFPQIARQVEDMKAKVGRPYVFWGQLGLENEDAKGILSDAKIDFVMDRCMMVEHKGMG